MGSFSPAHWLVVLAIVLIVFGAGRLPQTMGEVAKGVRAFRKGMREDVDQPPAEGDQADPARITPKA